MAMKTITGQNMTDMREEPLRGWIDSSKARNKARDSKRGVCRELGSGDLRSVAQNNLTLLRGSLTLLIITLFLP
jgi:hypothetical protein